MATRTRRNPVGSGNRVELGAQPAPAGSAADASLDELVQVVYERLRRLARHHLAGQRGRSLETVDLVDEAYLKIAHGQGAAWQDGAHFVAVASRAMRCVLVDHARRRGCAKRGDGPLRVSLAEAEGGAAPVSTEIVAVHEALNRLAELDPRKGGIVELRYFGGLTEEEIAQVMGLSARTVKREWRRAKAWLFRELAGPPP